jgi:Ca2+-transporting ATPase
VKFLLSANFDEILCIASAVLLSLPMPFLPIHILWLNLVTDSFPALALSNDVAEKSLMAKKPYLAKDEVTSGIISYALLAGLLGFVVTFVAFLFMFYYRNNSLTYAQTASFSAMVFFELFLVFSVRSEKSAFTIGFFSNKFLLIAVFIALALQLLAIYHPFLQGFLQTASLTWQDLGLLLLWSSSGFMMMELIKWVKSIYATRQ